MNDDIEPFIMLKTFDDKIFGVKNLRYEITGDDNVLIAEFSGDTTSAEHFLSEITEVMKRYCEENYKEYGVIRPNG